MDKKTVFQNTAWNTAGSSVYLACQWLTQIFVVRLYGGYTEAGYYALALSVTNIFYSIATNNNIRSYQVSDVRNEYSVGTYFTARVIMCSLSIVLCAVFVFFGGHSHL